VANAATPPPVAWSNPGHRVVADAAGLKSGGVIDTALVSESIADNVARITPQLAAGTELIGEYQGSGFQEPKYLVRRADGQVIQLPRLLYLLTIALNGRRDLQQVAAVLSDDFGRIVHAEQVAFLIEKKLQPAGIMAADKQGGDTDLPTKMTMMPDPLLALNFRVRVVPERVVWRIAGVFQPMFWPPVILVGLAAFVGLDVVIIAQGGLGQIVPSTLALVYQPGLTLLALGIVLATGAFHECGHVSACRYGGARPGGMGFGLYLLWPAMYSTVTDSYRLGRIGRLRTDLGGVYFNAVFIAAMNLAYLNTGSQWLLVTIALLHLETAIQFLPMIRMDGYFILSDLVGVPDLFSWMGPVLASMIPWRPTHPRVLELKPWVRWTITLWVVVVVPYLLYWVVGFLLIAPQVLPTVWTRLLEVLHTVGVAAVAGNITEMGLGVVVILLLVLPWAGSVLLLGMMARGPLQWTLARWSPTRARAGVSSC
jgi:putative peptide zinc metalloprotease protein